MRALIIVATSILAFPLRLAAQRNETLHASQFVLSSRHVYDEYHGVHLVTIRDDKTVVIVAGGCHAFPSSTW